MEDQNFDPCLYLSPLDQVKKEIIDYLGFEPPRIAGYYVAIKIFIRDKVDDDSLIHLSESTKNNDKYSSLVGRVVSMGNECYPMERNPGGPKCRIGDWVCFKPNGGTPLNYRGSPMQFVPDDAIFCPIDNPLYVTRC